MISINIWISGFLFTATIISLLIAVFSINKSNIPGAKAFAFLCFASTIYSFGYAMELLNSDLNVVLRWNLFQYCGIVFIPIFWFIVAIQYCRREQILSKFVKIFLFSFPIVMLIFRFTNSFHHLFYKNVYMSTEGAFPVMLIEKGPLSLINSTFTIFFVIWANILYFNLLTKSKGKIQYQTAIMFAASLLPFTSFFLSLFNISPYGIDFTPMTSTISYILLLVGLFKFHFFNFAPLAYHKVFENMKDAVIVFDRKYNILDYNLAATEVFCELDSHSIGKKVDLVFGSESDLLKVIFEDNEAQFELTKDNHRMFYILKKSVLTGKFNHVIGYIVTLNNISLQIENMNRLQLLASLDNLTEIYNRKYFLDFSEIELAKAKISKLPPSIIMIDLDWFKKINDRYGHQAGDAVLKHVANISKASIRSNDILGRFGGEEFIIFLPETSLEKAVEIGERLRGNIEKQNIFFESNIIKVTASFGVTAMSKTCEKSMDTLIKYADDALYLAKTNGRNCVKVVSN